MTRSHVLHHCPNAKIRAAREEAWEGKDPVSVRVLLSNPRWERMLLRSLRALGGGESDGCGRHGGEIEEEGFEEEKRMLIR
jgi:hypothetical protein